MKKLLIINRTQYGYNTDSYKFSQYLKDKMEVTYICLDKNKKRIAADGVEVIYINAKGNVLQRGINFIHKCNQLIREKEYDIVFVVYFTMSSLLSIMNSERKFILDIRTGAVSEKRYVNIMQNLRIYIESKFFQNITIISKSLQQKLGLKNCHILPLGSDQLSNKEKKFTTLKLLYIGTFVNRNIDETIKGLSLFLQRHCDVQITYDIVGYGRDFEVSKIIQTVEQYDLSEVVSFHGEKIHSEVQELFDECNVGVSYIPITPYFDCQPPTKTFEYINSAMICIATETSENKKLITQENGILCRDTPESFSDALQNIYERKDNFNSVVVSESLSQYSWEKISNENLYPYLLKIINTK